MTHEWLGAGTDTKTKQAHSTFTMIDAQLARGPCEDNGAAVSSDRRGSSPN
jgi:hypothetical protein